MVLYEFLSLKENTWKEDTMKIALSIFKDSISTVFDAADQLLILNMDGTTDPKRYTVKLNGTDPAGRANELKDEGIAVLICGAISRPLEGVIASAGIAIHPFVRGSVEEVIAAYQSGRLGQAVFSLPGCHRRGLGAGRGRGCGMRCPWR